jgi:hypothetical protein
VLFFRRRFSPLHRACRSALYHTGPASGGTVVEMSTPDRPTIRIGNQEREEAVRELGRHYAEGRLDAHEYEERTAAAYAARTADDLAPLFVDLPRGDQATVAVPPTGSVPQSWPGSSWTGTSTQGPPSPGQSWPAPTPGSADLDAPYGREPATGIPYSQRYKLIAGVLQIVLPFGVGRFYTGHIGTGVAQLLLSPIGIGMIWAFIDGILMLVGRPLDKESRPLRL